MILLTALTPLLTLGQQDSLSNEKGKWIFFGKERPDSIQSYSKPIQNGLYIHYRTDSTKSAEGMYQQNNKIGTWTYYYENGTSVRREEIYENNLLEGPYQEFYEDGTLKESGYYERNRQRNLISRYYPSGFLTYTANSDETGKEEGIVRYYFDCDSVNTSLGQVECVDHPRKLDVSSC